PQADLLGDPEVGVDREVGAVVLESGHGNDGHPVLVRDLPDLRPGESLVQQWLRRHVLRAPPPVPESVRHCRPAAPRSPPPVGRSRGGEVHRLGQDGGPGVFGPSPYAANAGTLTRMSFDPSAPAPSSARPATIGDLRGSGYAERSVKEELRQ